MRRFTEIVLTGLTVLFTIGAVASITGCEPETPKACDTRIEAGHPKLVPDDAGDVAILGTAWSSCVLVELSSFKVEVFLERELRGVWTYRTDVLSGGGIETCEEIPGREWIPCRRLFPGCISGRWRVRAVAEYAGADAEGRPQSGRFEVPEMPTTDIQCPGPEG